MLYSRVVANDNLPKESGMSADEMMVTDYDEPADELLAEDEWVEIERGLGFTDGFQFGCGFWAAAVVAAGLTGLGLLVLSFLLSFAGINLLG